MAEARSKPAAAEVRLGVRTADDGGTPTADPLSVVTAEDAPVGDFVGALARLLAEEESRQSPAGGRQG